MVIRSLGICLGASSIKVAGIRKDASGMEIETRILRTHESDPRSALVDVLKSLDLQSYTHAVVTGRKIREALRCPSITEPEAVEYALSWMRESGHTPDCTAVASLGAENFLVYLLDEQGAIRTVETGNKCASGTGEFFLQQIRRMDIDTDTAVRVARDSTPYKVSGRCSVFCKSDCTHALNKGTPVGRVTAGLSQMMADKILDLLEHVEHKRIMAIGGVTKNSVVMDYVRRYVETLHIPQEAELFEAIGAAYYGLCKNIPMQIDPDNPLITEKVSFSFLPALSSGNNLVTFKESVHAPARDQDRCVVGLDVGSTTTKAVVVRLEDSAILASVYLRTNGNPVAASRECYRELARQVAVPVSIVGLAVTGSGRQIAGLHAGTDVVINEIIAHATGAAFFDKEVDTIFEIGGQDAKYTYLTNSVPSDYAMNEACSAGTGSFLEESAKETLGIEYRSIEAVALRGNHPPNFNDQCAAFISSDIKTATHEGIAHEDIVAGLVYSICMNYVNRVKGQRLVGKKIFMQGGVCYNKAVPLAMANLIERPIVVPPDPGLIGAFGVALELKNRIDTGRVATARFDLSELARRDLAFGKSFTCRGGMTHCDRGCEINMVLVSGRKYPFGGACNKYYNLIHHVRHDAGRYDGVQVRQERLFRDLRADAAQGPTVGISRSYLANQLFPLYNGFFTSLGCRVVLSDGVDDDGIKRKRSSFCYPGEIAHGCFGNLLKKNTDFVFLPKIMGLEVKNSVSSAREHQSTCVLLQSEAYYLRSAFKSVPTRGRILSPLINFSEGLDSQQEVFAQLAREMGYSRAQGIAAYREAIARQDGFSADCKARGREMLSRLQSDPGAEAVVIFGRPYNAFASEANMGIPTKFASRGIMVIPWDFLPFEDETCNEDMCWAIGQNLLKASAFVKKHPQLYGAFITNFSCGPDSFVVGYFRDIMKTKPSLTLELDSHTADAGLNTRIEAFLDIVARYRELGKQDPEPVPFTPARVRCKGSTPHFITSRGEEVSFHDPRVHLLIPSMGRLGTEILAATFRGVGVKTSPMPVYDFDALKLGRANTSCKECLPLLLTVGGLLKYLEGRENREELLAYFMPFTPGNCRFPQYRVFLRSLIEKKRIENVAIFSLTAEKGYLYEAFSAKQRLRFLKGFIVHDVMEDIRNALTVLAVDRSAAMETFESEWSAILGVFESGRTGRLYAQLRQTAENLSKISLRYPLSRARKVGLMGEIFVRRDYFSCQDLLDRLAARDIIVKRSHFFEWLKYVDHIIDRGVYQPNFDLKGAIQFRAKLMLQNIFERKIKRILSGSGLYEYEIADIEKILSYGQRFFDLKFRGESILVSGNFFHDMLHSLHGVISIGPFACMPTRVIEAVLSAESTIDVMRSFPGNHGNTLPDVTNLPFLSIESDGNPFPQIIAARLEAFCLQVERLHGKLPAG